MEIQYLDKELIKKINVKALSLENESSVTINEGALDCVETVRYKYEEIENFKEKVLRKAAYLLKRLCEGHSFLDGNKRTSFLAATAFINNNLATNYVIEIVEYEKSIEFLKHVAEGKKSFNEVYKWLESIYFSE